MKQVLKGGDEIALTSRARARGQINARSRVWRKVKQGLNQRFRKEAKSSIRDQLAHLH